MASIKQYSPSGHYGPLALPLLLIAAVGGGVLAGWLYHIVAKEINLFIASQLGVGLVAGTALYAAIQLGKCRSPKLAVGFAVLAGLLAFGTFIGLQSFQWRAAVLRRLSSQPAVQAAASRKLTAFNTIRFYLEERAEAGVSLRPARTSYSSDSSRKQGDIRGWGYWLLLLFELALMVGATAGIALIAAYNVFCEKCNRWWQTATALTVRPEAAQQILQLARTGDWQGVRAVKTKRLFSHKNKCEVKVTGCPKCGDSEVQIILTTNGAAQTVFQQSADATVTRQLLARR